MCTANIKLHKQTCRIDYVGYIYPNSYVLGSRYFGKMIYLVKNVNEFSAIGLCSTMLFFCTYIRYQCRQNTVDWHCNIGFLGKPEKKSSCLATDHNCLWRIHLSAIILRELLGCVLACMCNLDRQWGSCRDIIKQLFWKRFKMLLVCIQKIWRRVLFIEDFCFIPILKA